MRSPISCAAWQRDRPVRKAAGRARSPEPQHLFISGRLIGRSLSFQPHPWLGACVAVLQEGSNEN